MNRHLFPLLTLCCMAVQAQTPSRHKDYASKEAQIVAWETRANAAQPLDKVMDAVGLRPGMTLGEVGASRGRTTLQFSKRVGPKGKVYANDIATDGLDFLRWRCSRHGITNVETVLGTPEDPRFPTKNLDMICMVWTYHMMEKPVEMLKSLAPYLQNGAALVMVEPLPSEIESEIKEAMARTGKKPSDIHIVSKDSVAREADQAGLRLEQVFDALLAKDYVYVLRKK